MLCTAKDENSTSVCKSGNEDILTNIVRNAFIDNPKSINSGYNFDHDPPILDGQTGVPHLVDKILGNMKLLLHFNHSKNEFRIIVISDSDI